MQIEIQNMAGRKDNMSKKKANKKEAATNVEFGQEFGDVNASKMFDTAPLTKDRVKSKAGKSK